MVAPSPALTLAPAVLTMSSREIAELCGKENKHVIRDIEKMLADIGDGPKVDHQGISKAYDARGYVSEIRLPKDLTVTLITGYRADLRYKVVKRLEELEASARTPPVPVLPQTYAEALRELAAAVEETEKMAVEIVRNLGLIFVFQCLMRHAMRGHEAGRWAWPMTREAMRMTADHQDSARELSIAAAETMEAVTALCRGFALDSDKVQTMVRYAHIRLGRMLVEGAAPVRCVRPRSDCRKFPE